MSDPSRLPCRQASITSYMTARPAVMEQESGPDSAQEQRHAEDVHEMSSESSDESEGESDIAFIDDQSQLSQHPSVNAVPQGESSEQEDLLDRYYIDSEPAPAVVGVEVATQVTVVMEDAAVQTDPDQRLLDLQAEVERLRAQLPVRRDVWEVYSDSDSDSDQSMIREIAGRKLRKE